MDMQPVISERQRRALLALIDVEAARAGTGQRQRRTAEHRLFALFRERYGLKYTRLPAALFRDAARWLLEEPLG
ncbi:hypothetical protein [uncultured Desulfovibrio sp.]|uniref:hypothetical protein n=1 Tax=uncultured Desulfovibrio sp. TaxID=167968 RepID=UPI002804FF1D|nr:hypothetical protein [uncultured Desulfovibrio sp.]